MESAPPDMGKVVAAAVCGAGWRQAFCVGHAESEILLDTSMNVEM